ncbi:hypothetical protein DFS33DRAFT_1387187 [Desarmillaria ectypa]|nr:hypothetical protein DFS33DRAFT_1387187 [Desarmillaria ectypa]
MDIPARELLHIPQDLVDSIIDELRDDSSALRLCYLVGRNWRPRSIFHLLQNSDVVLRSKADCLSFMKCERYVYPCVKSLTIVYADNPYGRRPSRIPDVFAPLAKLETLTLQGANCIRCISSDTLVSLSRLSDSGVGSLHTLVLQEIGTRVSPRTLPSFPTFLAAFTKLRKLKISSPTRFVAFGPERIKSLLDVEELELSHIRPVNWRHVTEFLDRRLNRLSVEICENQSDRCLEVLLRLAPS